MVGKNQIAMWVITNSIAKMDLSRYVGTSLMKNMPRTTGRKNTNKNIYYFINTLIKNIQIIVFLKMFDTLKDILNK